MMLAMHDKYPPIISIVTPSYNQGHYLEECIESVLGQGYPNLEYVIMDGGSTDGSLEIIKKYEKHLTYWQSHPDGGQYRAVNEGFRHTTGEIMGWINSDDKYHPIALAKAACVFADNPDIRWLTGRMNYWDAEGNLDTIATNLPIFSRLKNLEGHFNKPYLQQESTFWRRSLWEQAGGALSDSIGLAGDFELWSRFFRYGVLHTVDTLLGGYRYHGDQRGIGQAEEYLREAWEVTAQEREVYRQKGGALPAVPFPIALTRERLAAFVTAGGIQLESPSGRSCWRHYTENLIGMTNALVREKRLELADFFQNEVMLFGLAKPNAVSLMTDRLEEVRTLLQRVQRLNRQGEDYIVQGDDGRALAAFQEAISLVPSFAPALTNLALCFWRQGNREETVQYLIKSLSGHAHDRKVVLPAMEILMQFGAREQAMAVGDEYLMSNPHDDEIRHAQAKIGRQR
jgi:tetratricopeptide (TPR) repeat protein